MRKKNLNAGEVAKNCGVSLKLAMEWVKHCQLRALKLPGQSDNSNATNILSGYLQDSRIPVPNEFQGMFRRVLIVEDDLNLASAMQRSLKTAKFETAVAYDNFQAGALLGTFLPDVMTLDLKIPGFGGLNVLARVKNFPQFKDIKILVVSGMPIGDLQEALAAGAEDILQKPYEESVFVDKVRKLAEVKN